MAEFTAAREIASRHRSFSGSRLSPAGKRASKVRIRFTIDNAAAISDSAVGTSITPARTRFKSRHSKVRQHFGRCEYMEQCLTSKATHGCNSSESSSISSPANSKRPASRAPESSTSENSDPSQHKPHFVQRMDSSGWFILARVGQTDGEDFSRNRPAGA